MEVLDIKEDSDAHTVHTGDTTCSPELNANTDTSTAPKDDQDMSLPRTRTRTAATTEATTTERAGADTKVVIRSADLAVRIAALQKLIAQRKAMREAQAAQKAAEERERESSGD